MKKLAFIFLMAVVLVACTDTSTEETETQATEVEETKVLSTEEQKAIVIKFDEESMQLLNQSDEYADDFKTVMDDRVAGKISLEELTAKQEEFLEYFDDLAYEMSVLLKDEGLPEDIENLIREAQDGYVSYFDQKIEGTKIAFGMQEGDHKEFNDNAQISFMYGLSKVSEAKEKLGIPIE
ncbi:hypothetical protein ACINKY_21345 [Paenibacillus illinoisensis]|uniref:Lipoprotein n=1 Tax=Paenibacillus illinoisensis TaxID=59845 RepID=A0ABW8I0P6_9BACL